MGNEAKSKTTLTI